MKSPLVLGSALGGMALVGAAAVGMTYFALRAASPTPQASAPHPVTAAGSPSLNTPPMVEEPPLPRPIWPKAARIHTHRRACPVPAVYHPRRRPHYAQPMRMRMVQSAYPPPPPPLVEGYPGPYGRAGWRRPGWRGPGWRYPPRWAYGPRPGFGPGWRDW
ncbi:hypothetical protein [Caulobacter sp. S45]|uniref:hypothetical protein n=1 Tax=Caulobacter sp. S45 TaxID=1641861 RepID=UPI0015760E0D|nr:hypothetical protein [Caulobacter sp. S45]